MERERIEVESKISRTLTVESRPGIVVLAESAPSHRVEVESKINRVLCVESGFEMELR